MKITDEQYRKAARTIYQEEGEVEIDDNAKISRDDDDEGVYVAAWVWVPADAAKRETTSDKA